MSEIVTHEFVDAERGHWVMHVRSNHLSLRGVGDPIRDTVTSCRTVEVGEGEQRQLRPQTAQTETSGPKLRPSIGGNSGL